MPRKNLFEGLWVPFLFVSIAFLAACKPEEILISHSDSVLRENTSLFAISPKECIVLFEVDNKNSDAIDHLGFSVTVFDRQAADLAWQNSLGQMIGMQSSASSRTAKTFSHSENIRFKNIASGKSKLSTRFPQAGCNNSFTVAMRGFSCRIGETDCAEAVVVKEY